MSLLYFYGAAFGACLLLLLVSHAALAAAQKDGDGRRLYLLHLLRAGLSLSAVSYLLRVIGALHHSPVTELSSVTGFLGTLFLWLGWMEHWKMRGERQGRRPVPSDEEGGPALGPLSAAPPAAGTSLLTARTHQVLRHATDEACRRHECCVDTEHLLLGLLRDSGSAGVHVLRLLGAEPEKVHLELLAQMTSSRKITKRPEREAGTDLRAGAEPAALTERAGQVLALAAQEAHRFDRASVGTEHLLLGLVLVGKGKAAAVLFQEGVTVDGIRAEIIKARRAA